MYELQNQAQIFSIALIAFYRSFGKGKGDSCSEYVDEMKVASNIMNAIRDINKTDSNTDFAQGLREAYNIIISFITEFQTIEYGDELEQAADNVRVQANELKIKFEDIIGKLKY